ncbi:MAG: DUF63 family protein [Haloarculaceae archaeon]
MQVLGTRLDPERTWLGTLVASVVVLAGASIALTERFYYGVVWRYFWGPVYADAQGASCAVHYPDAGTTVLDAAGCEPGGSAIVAFPGYTLVSELGYMTILLFMLAGIYLMLKRLSLSPYRDFFYALVPWMLFGGALRVVEDAFDMARSQGITPAIEYPLNTLLISPVIYVTVFVLAFASLLASKQLQSRGVTETYHYPLGAMGLGAVAVTLGYIASLSFGTAYVEWHPEILVTVVGLASLIAIVSYVATERFRPAVNAGTGLIGLVVIWGHAIDGVANVLASDWTWLFGLPAYGSKHPVDRILADIVTTFQPASVTAAIGDSWLFLVVKIVVAVVIVSLFDETFMDDSPRYAIMLLGAILAVGLGPGTRDMLRVAFGI